jgi:hypothetical protein
MGVAVVLLLLPTVINVAIPERANPYRQLVLDAFGSEWNVPVVTQSGAPVQCELAVDDFVTRSWSCNDQTTIITQIVEGSEDPESTLRRMVRANLALEAPADAQFVSSEDGRAHLLVDSSGYSSFWGDPVAAIGLDGSGDEEDLTAIAIIDGAAAQYYSEAIWGSMATERGLTYDAQLPLGIGTGTVGPDLDDTWPGFPLDPLPERHGLIGQNGRDAA